MILFQLCGLLGRRIIILRGIFEELLQKKRQCLLVEIPAVFGNIGSRKLLHRIRIGRTGKRRGKLDRSAVFYQRGGSRIPIPRGLALKNIHHGDLIPMQTKIPKLRRQIACAVLIGNIRLQVRLILKQGSIAGS